MRTKILSVATVAIFAIGASLLSLPSCAAEPASTVTANLVKVDATKMVLRDLWTQHVFWVRNVAVARIDHNKLAEKEAETKVVANAHALAGSIEPFYGAAAKDKLFTLLA